MLARYVTDSLRKNQKYALLSSLNDEKTSSDSTQPLVTQTLALKWLTELSELSSSVTEKELAPSIELSTSFLFGTGIAALGSAVVFYFDGKKAGERYAAMVKNSAWLFEWVGAICSALTNILFNWQAFIDNLKDESSIASWFISSVAFCYNMPLKTLVKLCSSAGCVIPFWYISLTGSKAYNVLNSISGVLNLYVNFSGVEVCYQIVENVEVQRFRLNSQIAYARLCCADTSKLQLQLEWVNAKAVFVDQLKECYRAYFYANDSDRKNFIQLCSDENKTLKAMLNYAVHLTPMPNDIQSNFFLRFFKYLLNLLGVFQNFGHLVIAYQVGALIHPALGVFLLLCNFLPSLGFTIKGILGMGPVELLYDAYHGRTSQMQRLLPYSLVFIILVRICYLFSGLSGDEINYEAAIALGIDKKTAFVFGLAADVGTAAVYNGPQCEGNVLLLLEAYVLAYFAQYEPQILTQQLSRSFCEKIEYSSIEEFQNFVSDEKISETAFTFFAEKNIDTEKLQSIVALKATV